jgi:hypothetical protein
VKKTTTTTVKAAANKMDESVLDEGVRALEENFSKISPQVSSTESFGIVVFLGRVLKRGLHNATFFI